MSIISLCLKDIVYKTIFYDETLFFYNLIIREEEFELWVKEIRKYQPVELKNSWLYNENLDFVLIVIDFYFMDLEQTPYN